jgi:predicted permease
MLGHAYWQRRFASDPAVVGRSVRIGREVITVIGVVPQGFERSIDIWLPIRNPPALRGFTEGYARLRDGISLDVAQREWTAELQKGAPWPSGATIQLTPLLEDVSRGSRKMMKTLAGGVGLILLIACVNVGGLLLARGSTRASELAVRAAIGAGRIRLVRQLLTESVVLAAAGTVSGIFLAWLFLDAIVALVPLDLPDSSTPALNWLVVGLTGATAAATALIFGMVPARRLSRAAVTSIGTGGNRHGSEPLTRRTGQILIAIELALAVVLLAGAGLLLRSLDRLLTVDLGFDPDAVVVVRAAPAEPAPESRQAFYANLLDACRRLPGVIAAGATDAAPLAPRGSSTNFSSPGRPPQMFDAQLVSPGYFETLGIVARAGRLFAEDDRNAERVVLDDMAAAQLFPDGNAVGGMVTWFKTNYEVVGVVGHIKRGGALREVERGNVYRLIPSNHAGVLDVVLRPLPGVTVPANTLRQTAMSAGAGVVVDRVGPGSELLSENVVTPRRRTILLSILAGLGLLLTLVGIASVTAYAVARRTREIGVRIAFGASPPSVVWNMVADAAWPMVAGLAAGLGASLYATRLIATFLFDTQPHDALTFVAAAAVILITSAIAAWLPARRAASVDPVLALRSE